MSAAYAAAVWDDRVPVTLARAVTARGEIALRERREAGRVIHELIVAGVFAMDSREVSTETELAGAALARCPRPARVLVGGLGLGYTAAALLADPGVEKIVVAEIEGPLIDWATAGLTPQLAALAASPRVELREQDIAAALESPGCYDAILLDVDNGPSFLVHPHNARLYADRPLSQAMSRLAPGGALSIWAAQREPELLRRLIRLCRSRRGWSADERVLPTEREGRMLDYFLYSVDRPA